MNARRVERTLLHRTYSIFRYAEELELQGISSPSEQIVAIGRFIVDELGQATELPRLSDEEAVEQWMGKALAHTASCLRQQPFTQEPLNQSTQDSYTHAATLLSCSVASRSTSARTSGSS